MAQHGVLGKQVGVLILRLGICVVFQGARREDGGDLKTDGNRSRAEQRCFLRGFGGYGYVKGWVGYAGLISWAGRVALRWMSACRSRLVVGGQVEQSRGVFHLRGREGGGGGGHESRTRLRLKGAIYDYIFAYNAEWISNRPGVSFLSFFLSSSFFSGEGSIVRCKESFLPDMFFAGFGV